MRSARSATASKPHAATARLRLHEDQMIVPPLGREPGVAEHPADHQKGRGRLGEIVPAWLQRARLEAEPPGGEQDAAEPDPASAAGAAADLGRREGPIQHAAQLGEREDQVVGSGCGGRCGSLAPALGMRCATDTAPARSLRTNLLIEPNKPKGVSCRIETT